tara:strand:+ start:755 stop:1480 length:726 start_codon:yes stop_codon:yes gene_type:complete
MIQIKNDVAIIVCGHGSRNINYRNSLIRLTNYLKTRLNNDNLFYCFIEINHPLLEDCINSLIKKYLRIYIFPLFIFDGKHYKSDINQTLTKFKKRKSIMLIERLSLLDDILPIISHILKNKIKAGKKYFLITSCSPSNDNNVMKQLSIYTRLLSQNLGLTNFDQHFVGEETKSILKAEKILRPDDFVILHPVFFIDGFLSKKNILNFKKIFKKRIFILKPLIFYKEIKRRIEKTIEKSQNL